MKACVVLACVLSTSVAFAQTVEPKTHPKVVTDQFTGKTEINYPITPYPAKDFLAYFSGKVSPKRGVMFVYSGGSTEWRYLRCHQVAFLVDGKPTPVPSASHDGSVFSGGVSESVIVPSIPISTIRAMGNATSVEFRVCNDEFFMDEEEIAGLRELAQMYDTYK